jgi:phosphate transport system substrate-binding protein
MTTLHGRAYRLLPLVLTLAFFAAACGDDNSGSSGGSGSGNVSGEIAVSGSSTVEPISAANAQKFSSANPDVAISVEGPGTGDGFALFCDGKTDVSDASRPIDPDEELPACK